LPEGLFPCGGNVTVGDKSGELRGPPDGGGGIIPPAKKQKFWRYLK